MNDYLTGDACIYSAERVEYISGRYGDTKRGSVLRTAKGHICIIIAVLWGMSAVSPAAGKSKVKFNSYELKAKTGEILSFDFDGDGLDDIVVINEPNLIFFFQDSKDGFAEEAELMYSAGGKPSIVWPAKLGNGHGISYLLFSNIYAGFGHLCKTRPQRLKKKPW